MKNTLSENVIHVAARTASRAAGCILACALAACATSRGPADAPPALQGSAWQLAGYTPATGHPPVEVQAGQVVFTFGSDGRLSAKLDCNRGAASYTVVPEGPSHGLLQVGPLGVTRMMCPDSNALAATLAHDLENLASYRVSGDKLVLSGGQGTGTYVWARTAQ